MANKHIKRCSTLLITVGMQIKTTMTYHLIPVKIAVISNKRCQGCWENETCLQCSWEWIGDAPVKTSMTVSKKTENICDIAVLLLGLCPKKTKTLIWKQICTSIFTAALFTIAKIWKQPKCISVDEWVKKTWYICVTKYCLATKYKENFASV